eukprot:scaffold25029_cov75-Phaeocystis_antarctica.AAC.6
MGAASTARPHAPKASGGVQTSSLVPPQLLETRPTGTGAPARRASASATLRPKNQQTAEKVEKSVWPGPKSSRMVVFDATCHGSHTVCKSSSGVADEVPWPTEKMRMCG